MKTKIYLTALVGLCYSWNIARGQSFNLEPASSEQTLVGLKASLPVFKNIEDYNVKAMSGTYTLYSAIPFGKKGSVYAEVPFIYRNDVYESESGIGNIFLTVRMALDEERTSQISFGTFFPTVSEDNDTFTFIETALYSNYYRWSTVLPAYTIYGNYSYITDEEKKYILGGEVGPELMIPKNGGETELIFHLSLVAGWRFENLSFWAELNDIMLASVPDISFNDRNINQLLFCGQYDFGVVRPGLCYMLPLKDELNDYQKSAIGFKVDFSF